MEDTLPDTTRTIQTWNTTAYAANGRFVATMATAVVELLAPLAGEEILDVGCGDGALTQQVAASGAILTGVDASSAMVAAARARDAAGALLDVDGEVVIVVEGVVGAGAGDDEGGVGGAVPTGGCDVEASAPGVARVGVVSGLGEGLLDVVVAGVGVDVFVDLGREVADLGGEGLLVAVVVFGELLLREAAAKLGVEFGGSG